MGLTGGVKSHRLSGQISPYCEKNVIGSARIARLCFKVRGSPKAIQSCIIVILKYPRILYAKSSNGV